MKSSKEIEQKLRLYRLSGDEHQKICKLLGREPEGLEWALFSALWSEHCSYKSSKRVLRSFARTLNERSKGGDQENAGVIDLGQGERVAFKMESHNHPSFIEPFQGAATGVGGILRDIFTMGARPILLADYLCFGIDRPDLVDGVVRGISSYGNSVGVPTATGKTHFDPSYNKNILVNALAVGYLGPEDVLASSCAQGVGNCVVYVGAKTGRDGVHGASMASENFGENSEAKKPNVQIGDPFYEKLLIESCIEVINRKWVVAIQDMGAAGLTSSTFEMASKGQVGFRMNLDLVPLRDASMEPEEIMLSESQERMLLVCHPDRLSDIQQVFAKWGLDAVQIGEVLAEKRVVLQWRGEVIADLDPDLLVQNAPQYHRESTAFKKSLPENNNSLDVPLRANRIDALLNQIEMQSKRPIFRQYDQRVGGKTLADAEQDVACVRLPASTRGLTLALGCRPQLMKQNAYLGAMDAVIQPTLQMALVGARALAVTDCLNFGDPTRIPVMTDFEASVQGIVDASLLHGTPVISGNVSFYNETQTEKNSANASGGAVVPTPATGVVGLKESGLQNHPSARFLNADQWIYAVQMNSCQWVDLAKEVTADLGCFGKTLTPTGDWKLEETISFRDAMIELSPLIESAKLVGSYGRLGALLKMCSESLGFVLRENPTERDLLAPMYEAVLVVAAEKRAEFEKILAKHSKNVRWNLLGEVTGGLAGGSISWPSLKGSGVLSSKMITEKLAKGLVEHVPTLS